MPPTYGFCSGAPRKSFVILKCVKWLQQKTSGYWTKRALCLIVGLIIMNVLFHPHSLPRSYDYIKKDNVSLFWSSPSMNGEKHRCMFNGGRVNIQTVLQKIKSKDFSLDDGNLRTIWKKMGCIPYKIAIVVPYRNRQEQLHVFLQYMHWFLQKQLLDYHIYVVEQSGEMDFNRALLLNIGYVESKKRDELPCFIFHDVDLLPENLENVYACTTCPRHMSACVNTLRYTLIYRGLFGGVVAMLSKQFELVNGFSNRYFGWGGEDDDMYKRMEHKNLVICRFSPAISRYTMLAHKAATPNPSRHTFLKKTLENQHQDGLNNITNKYRLLKSESRLRLTVLRVEILK